MSSITSDQISAFMSNASWIRQMFETGAELKKKLGAENVFDLSLGNPVIEPPAAFFETLKELSNPEVRGLHRYMNNAGFEDVREIIAQDLKKKQWIPTTKDHINMCVGAGGGLNVMLKALLNPGDEVIILTPFFVEYRFYIQNHGGVPVTVNTDANFDLDLDALESAFTDKTRAILLCSPNNPTGTIYSQEKIDALHKRLNARSGKPIFLISDEPYRDIYYGEDQLPSPVAGYRNSAVIYSWSKSLSIPGDRIGYIALHKDVEDDTLPSALTFCTRILGFVNAPATMQLVVKKIINSEPPLETYRSLRTKVLAGLDALGYDYVTPMGGFYAFPKVPEKYQGDDIAFVNDAQQQAVLLVPGTGFGCPGHVRLSYAVDEWVVEGAIEKLKAL